LESVADKFAFGTHGQVGYYQKFIDVYNEQIGAVGIFDFNIIYY
jgi:hypothetical protein